MFHPPPYAVIMRTGVRESETERRGADGRSAFGEDFFETRQVAAAFIRAVDDDPRSGVILVDTNQRMTIVGQEHRVGQFRE